MSRLSKNIVYNLVGQSVIVVLGFVAVKYVFRQLGEDALGIIYFTATLNVVLCGVLNKGVHTVTIREISAYLSNEPDYIRNYIKTWSLLCWGGFVIFSIAIYFFAPVLVESWINLKTLDSVTATNILQILGIASLTALPLSFYSSLLQGLQRMEFNNIIDVTTSGIQQLGIVFIILSGGDLYHIAYWTAASYVIRIVAYIVMSSHFFTIQSLIPGFSFSVVKRNYEFATKMVNISVLAMIHRQSDKLIVSKLLPIGQLGYYSLAFGAIAKGGLITSAVAQAAYPSLCKLCKTDNQLGLLSQYRKIQDFICFVTIPIFVVVPFIALPLFTYIFNTEIAERLFLPVTLLSLGFFLNGTLSIPYRLLLAKGKPGIAVKQNFYALFIVLPLTFISIYYFGLSGAALGWVFYFLFGYVYAIPRVFAECLQKPAWFFYGHMFKVFLLATVTYGVAYGILAVVNIFTIHSLFMSYTGASVIFLIGAYFLIGDELRKTALGHFRIVRDKLNFRTILSGNGRNGKI